MKKTQIKRKRTPRPVEQQRAPPPIAEISKKTGLPQKTIALFSPRQQRYLSKIGLMPLTGYPKISERTQIPRHYLERTLRFDIRFLRTKLDLIERLEKNPATAHLLNHPSLWAIARIRELAPTKFAPQIHQELIKEARKRNARISNIYKRRVTAYKVPIPETISGISRRLKFRTAEDLKNLQVEQGKKHPKKGVPNKLTDTERRALLVDAQKRISTEYYHGGEGFTGDDVRAEIMRQLEKRVVTFQPGNYQTRKELIRRWRAYLFGNNKKIIKFLTALALREVGPFNRKGKRKKIHPDEHIKQRRDRTKPVVKIRFYPKLTTQESLVWELKRQGFPQKEIASKMDLSPSTISGIMRKIEQKVVV